MTLLRRISSILVVGTAIIPITVYFVIALSVAFLEKIDLE